MNVLQIPMLGFKKALKVSVVCSRLTRYHFELIQYDRDANKLADTEGRIIIEVFEDKLVISNNFADSDIYESVF